MEVKNIALISLNILEWNQDFTIASNGVNGAEAKVHAKIDSNGQLGFLEVQDSGTLFDDTVGPILVSLLPPKPASSEVAAREVAVAPAADALAW